MRQLLNLLEDVRADLRAAQAEIQRLRNEINRLKGEQGRPTTKSNQRQPPSTTTRVHSRWVASAMRRLRCERYAAWFLCW